ncbi:M48 family metalloprotease [Streptomyces albus]|uniref:M48 family metalloprotease n=1 Tax=Streptomyces albus TaxID=1888 RepID=UPI003F1C49EA
MTQPPDPTRPKVPPPPKHPPRHPHEMDFAPRRIHLARHQRGMDATAVGRLVLHLPHMLGSLLVVLLCSLLLDGLWFVLVAAWLLSGALVFHRPTEAVLARRLLGLRHPSPWERARLEPVWREVTARAGVDGRAYQLWVEDSQDLNAVAAAGHIVGVTSYALHQIPSGQLAAVLAHELGHHTGGHAWSSLLGFWYSVPGRIALWACRLVLSGLLRAIGNLARFGCFFLLVPLAALLVLASLAYATLTSLYGLPLLLPVLPYLLAAVGRRAELRADQHAAALGFAPMLAEVLRLTAPPEQPAPPPYGAAGWAPGGLHPGFPHPGRAPAGAFGHQPVGARPTDRRGALARLLDTHPDHFTRLHHLQPYLEPGR